MPRNWNAAADASNGLYRQEDFKQALYQLVTSQTLYARFKKQVGAYRIISRYRDEFAEAADLMGLKLLFNDAHEYCYVIPELERNTSLSIQETNLVLVLRHIYHVHASTGELDIQGDTHVTLTELYEAYKSLVGDDLTKYADELKSQLKFAVQCGMARIAKTDEGDPQPFRLLLLPVISDILTEAAIGRLGAQIKADLENAAETLTETPVEEEEEADENAE